jgi:hypothetical protein
LVEVEAAAQEVTVVGLAVEETEAASCFSEAALSQQQGVYRLMVPLGRAVAAQEVAAAAQGVLY